MNNCKYEIWKLKDFDKINLPKFQRNIVWSTAQRKELFDTIKKGLPFGSLLVYEMQIGEATRYEIIDGLQRLSSIRDIVKNRKDY